MAELNSISPLVSELLLHGGPRGSAQTASPRHTSTSNAQKGDARLTALQHSGRTETGRARSTDQVLAPALINPNPLNSRTSLNTLPNELLLWIEHHSSASARANWAQTNRRFFALLQPRLTREQLERGIPAINLADHDEPQRTIAAIDKHVPGPLRDQFLTTLAAYVVQTCASLPRHGYQKMEQFLTSAEEYVQTGSARLTAIANSMRQIVNAMGQCDVPTLRSPNERDEAISAVRTGQSAEDAIREFALLDPLDRVLVQAAEIIYAAGGNVRQNEAHRSDLLARFTQAQLQLLESGTLPEDDGPPLPFLQERAPSLTQRRDDSRERGEQPSVASRLKAWMSSCTSR